MKAQTELDKIRKAARELAPANATAENIEGLRAICNAIKAAVDSGDIHDYEIPGYLSPTANIYPEGDARDRGAWRTLQNFQEYTVKGWAEATGWRSSGQTDYRAYRVNSAIEAAELADEILTAVKEW